MTKQYRIVCDRRTKTYKGIISEDAVLPYVVSKQGGSYPNTNTYTSMSHSLQSALLNLEDVKRRGELYVCYRSVGSGDYEVLEQTNYRIQSRLVSDWGDEENDEA